MEKGLGKECDEKENHIYVRLHPNNSRSRKENFKEITFKRVLKEDWDTTLGSIIRWLKNNKYGEGDSAFYRYKGSSNSFECKKENIKDAKFEDFITNNRMKFAHVMQDPSEDNEKVKKKL